MAAALLLTAAGGERKPPPPAPVPSAPASPAANAGKTPGPGQVPPPASNDRAPLTADEKSRKALEGHFINDPQIEKLEKRLAAEDYKGLVEEASQLVKQSDEHFGSPRKAAGTRARALSLRGEAELLLNQPVEAFRDFQQAAELGSSTAALKAAELLASAASQAPDEPTRRSLIAASIHWDTMAAELGETPAMLRLRAFYKERREKGGGDVEAIADEGNYWFLLSELNHIGPNAPAAISTFVANTRKIFDTTDIAELEGSVRRRALSWRPMKPGFQSRSYLTCAFVDARMGRQLEIAWRAFFDESTVEENRSGVMEVYQYYKESVPENSFCEVGLLAVGDARKSLPKAMPISREDVGEALMPNDFLFLADGDNAHYAVLWSLDTEDDSALILDPFPEFWSPGQNGTITSREFVDYKHSRQLVKVKLSEVAKCLVAVFAIRDKT